MNYQEAWSMVATQFPDTEPEIANELDGGFVFYLKPKGAPDGWVTGYTGIYVDKQTKELSSVYPGDIRLYQSKTLKIYRQGSIYLEM